MSNSTITDEGTLPPTEETQSWTLGILDNFLFSGGTLFLIFVVIMIIAILVSTLGNENGEYSMQQSVTDKTNNLFIVLIVAILCILALVGGIQYLFKTDIYTTLTKDGTTNEIDIVIDHKTGKREEEDTDEPKPEVFNIPGNYYSYDKAQNLCKAYGARLANYNEIETAYENGAQWCNYGWSDKQLALFPTQQETYDELQKIPGHEHDCGRPGINGGFMANPDVEYGVNCFGMKPDISNDEKFLMENSTIYPKTRKDKVQDTQVENLKKQLGDILISPFNAKNWSRY
jgi:hypothetical protein